MSTRLAPVAAHAHVQDRGTPPAGLMRQAPDHRVTRLALAPATSTPPVLTSNTARQHCMVCLNALTRHLQPQAIQARERAQIRAIKGSIGHVEVFQMDGVGTPIIERPRPLPGHDTPNPTQHPYPPNYEEPLITQKQFLGVVPGSMRRPPDLRAMMHPVRACVAGDLAAHHREESRHQTIVDPRDTRQWNRTRLRPVNLS